ncbi:hypothetical protein ACHAWF_004947 [Thalassiosira exigua]
MNTDRSSAALSSKRGGLFEGLSRREHVNQEDLEVNSSGNVIVARPAVPRKRSRKPSLRGTKSDRLGKKVRPRVTFSEKSTLQIYIPDPRYTRSKSYTREDKEKFSFEALSEIMRIKRLVVATPGSTKDSFRYLLEEKIVSVEEIVGIEHIVLGKSASKLAKERQDHALAVLSEQERQLCGASKVEDDPIENLGQFSASRSSKSARRARIRAAMAA